MCNVSKYWKITRKNVFEAGFVNFKYSQLIELNVCENKFYHWKERNVLVLNQDVCYDFLCICK